MFPEILEIGPLHLRSYGLMLALGFLAGTWLALRNARRQGLDPDRLVTLILIVLLAGVAGARAFYVATHWSYFAPRPLEVFAVWHGGLTLWGGFVLAVPLGLFYTRRLRLPTWRVADAMAAPVALGAAIGRVGCFLNGCCYGVPTALPWGVRFPAGSPPHLEFGGAALHPAQLYNTAAGLVTLAVVLWAEPRLRAPGQLWWLALGLYALLRAAVDVTRLYEPAAVWAGGITESQAIGLGLAAVSAFFFWWLGRRHAAGGTA